MPEAIGGKVIWSASAIALGIVVVYFVNSLSWLFPATIMPVLNYLAIVFFVIALLIIW